MAKLYPITCYVFLGIVVDVSPMTCFTLQQGDPIEERYKEFMERGSVIDQLIYCIGSYREAAMSNDPKFDHIDIPEKQKVGIYHHVNRCLPHNCWVFIS